MTAPLFSHSVKVDGGEIAGITLTGATINYGTRRPDEPATPANAYLTLVTADAWPALGASYPGFSWGAGIPSGFVDEYRDKYEGADPRINLGASVVIGVSTPTGFVDEYVDAYSTGVDTVRFTGVITALDVLPGTVAITAVTRGEQLSRIMVDPLGWPAETDAARVVRIAQLAGLTIRVIGPVTANVAATAAVDPADTTPQLVSAWQLLTDLALDCEALLYTDRYGELQYRTRTANTGSTTVELDPGATLLDGLQLTAELGAIVNTVIVEYGPPDTRAEVERSDAASIAAYGRRELKLSTQLADQAGAIGRAERYLAHYKAPQWSMPGATVNLRLAESAHSFPAYVEQLLDLDLDDSVTLPQLLPASPIPAYSSRVLGYVETLDPYAWSITYSLNPYGWTGD